MSLPSTTSDHNDFSPFIARITGISGSGKSSLLKQLSKNLFLPFDNSNHLIYKDIFQPAVLLSETTITNKTIGSLFKVGKQIIENIYRYPVLKCSDCHKTLKNNTWQEFCDFIWNKLQSEKVTILLVLKGSILINNLNKLVEMGLTKVTSAGSEINLEMQGAININQNEHYSILLDTLILKDRNQSRLFNSFEVAQDFEYEKIQILQYQFLNVSGFLCIDCGKIFTLPQEDFWQLERITQTETEKIKPLKFGKYGIYDLLFSSFQEFKHIPPDILSSELTEVISILKQIGLAEFNFCSNLRNIPKEKYNLLNCLKYRYFSPLGLTYLFDEPVLSNDTEDINNFSILCQILKKSGSSVIYTTSKPNKKIIFDKELTIGSTNSSLRVPHINELMTEKDGPLSVNFNLSGQTCTVNLNTINYWEKTLNSNKHFSIQNLSELITENPGLKEVFSGVELLTIPTKSQLSLIDWLDLGDGISKLYSQLITAKTSGLSKLHFTLKQNGIGFCSHCSGIGFLEFKECDYCKGKVFCQKVLKVKFKGLSIYDLFNLKISESREILQILPKMPQFYELADLLNLSGLLLKQSILTLSSGELDRANIIRILLKRQKNKLLILENPFKHLDPHNEAVLQQVISRLFLNKNTILIA